MKTKILLRLAFSVLVLLFYLNADAQLEKGHLMIGGDAGFRNFSPKGGSETTSLLTISPGVGYFVIDHLALGARISFINISSDGSTFSSFSVGPFARYFIGDTKVFGELSYDFG